MLHFLWWRRATFSMAGAGAGGRAARQGTARGHGRAREGAGQGGQSRG